MATWKGVKFKKPKTIHPLLEKPQWNLLLGVGLGLQHEASLRIVRYT